MHTKFYVCRHCGNLIGLIHDASVPLVCCGEKMQLLEANTFEGKGEKHLPVVKVEGNEITVNVGSAAHPMTDEHYIQWIYLQTEKGGQRKNLKPGEDPQVKFTVTDDKPVAVCAYCNQHGLWKTEL